MPTLRVSAQSRPNAVAGAVAALLRLDGAVEVQAIGPHAVNQAVKSLAIARAYLVQDELDLIVAPGFVKLELHDEERTAMRFDVRAVPLGTAPALRATTAASPAAGSAAAADARTPEAGGPVPTDAPTPAAGDAATPTGATDPEPRR